MKLISRILGLLFTPKKEWNKIKTETETGTNNYFYLIKSFIILALRGKVWVKTIENSE